MEHRDMRHGRLFLMHCLPRASTVAGAPRLPEKSNTITVIAGCMADSFLLNGSLKFCTYEG